MTFCRLGSVPLAGLWAVDRSSQRHTLWNQIAQKSGPRVMLRGPLLGVGIAHSVMTPDGTG